MSRFFHLPLCKMDGRYDASARFGRT